MICLPGIGSSSYTYSVSRRSCRGNLVLKLVSRLHSAHRDEAIYAWGDCYAREPRRRQGATLSPLLRERPEEIAVSCCDLGVRTSSMCRVKVLPGVVDLFITHATERQEHVLRLSGVSGEPARQRACVGHRRRRGASPAGETTTSCSSRAPRTIAVVDSADVFRPGTPIIHPQRRPTGQRRLLKAK